MAASSASNFSSFLPTNRKSSITPSSSKFILTLCASSNIKAVASHHRSSIKAVASHRRSSIRQATSAPSSSSSPSCTDDTLPRKLLSLSLPTADFNILQQLDRDVPDWFDTADGNYRGFEMCKDLGILDRIPSIIEALTNIYTSFKGFEDLAFLDKILRLVSALQNIHAFYIYKGFKSRYNSSSSLDINLLFFELALSGVCALGDIYPLCIGLKMWKDSGLVSAGSLQANSSATWSGNEMPLMAPSLAKLIVQRLIGPPVTPVGSTKQLCHQNDVCPHCSSGHPFVGDRYKQFGNLFLSPHRSISNTGSSICQAKPPFQMISAGPKSGVACCTGDTSAAPPVTSLAEEVTPQVQLIKEGLPHDSTSSLNINLLFRAVALSGVCALGAIYPLCLGLKMWKDSGLVSAGSLQASSTGAFMALSLTKLIAQWLIWPPVGSTKQFSLHINILGHTYNCSPISGNSPITFIILTCVYMLFTFFLYCELVKAIHSRKV